MAKKTATKNAPQSTEVTPEVETEEVVTNADEAEAGADAEATKETATKNVVKNLHGSPLQIPTGQTVPVGGSVALTYAHAKKCKSHAVFASWVKAGVLEIN